MLEVPRHRPEAGSTVTPHRPCGRRLTPVKKAIAVRRRVSSALRSRGNKFPNRPRRWWSAWATMALGMERKRAFSLLWAPHPGRRLRPTPLLPLPLPPPTPSPAPGQQQDAFEVGVGSHQPPPASSLFHARDHHAAAVPGEQGLQGLHSAAGGGGRQRGGRGVRAGRAPAQASLRSGVCPHLAWLCGGPRSDGVQALGVSGEDARRASWCSWVTSTSRRCG